MSIEFTENANKVLVKQIYQDAHDAVWAEWQKTGNESGDTDDLHMAGLAAVIEWATAKSTRFPCGPGSPPLVYRTTPRINGAAFTLHFDGVKESVSYEEQE